MAAASTVGASTVDKNHNHSKGTETMRAISLIVLKILIRTIIPARGRKLLFFLELLVQPHIDKNHNPRKGTETIGKQTSIE